MIVGILKYIQWIMLFLCLISPAAVYSMGENLLPPDHASGTFLMKYQGSSAGLDPYIEELRHQAYQSGSSIEAKTVLAAFILKKISLMPNAKYDEIENLFCEMSDLLPGNMLIEKVWGETLFKKGNYEDAAYHFENALQTNPDNLDIQSFLGLTLHKLMQYEKALYYLENVYTVRQNNFYLLYTIGICHYELQDYASAIEFLEKALPLAPNEKDAEILQGLIRKAREMEASSDGCTTDENQRFIVHFAGNSQDDIGDTIMEVLDEIYDQVTADLMLNPDIQVNVVFFRTEEFYDVNQVGKWVGALARGVKILVPLKQGYSNMNSIRGILAHEFTHVIVNLKTNNRCPVWINEGLAVYQEFQGMNSDPCVLRPDYEKLFQSEIVDKKNFLSLRKINLNPSQQMTDLDIPLGYLTSYLSMRFLIERWGNQGVDQLLSSIGEGKHIDEAMTEASGMDMNDFEREFFDWMNSF